MRDSRPMDAIVLQALRGHLVAEGLRLSEGNDNNRLTAQLDTQVALAITAPEGGRDDAARAFLLHVHVTLPPIGNGNDKQRILQLINADNGACLLGSLHRTPDGKLTHRSELLIDSDAPLGAQVKQVTLHLEWALRAASDGYDRIEAAL